MNIWIAEVSLKDRKSCPNCAVKLAEDNSIISVGEYIHGKYYKGAYCCALCYSDWIASRGVKRPYTIKVRSGCSVRWY